VISKRGLRKLIERHPFSAPVPSLHWCWMANGN